MSELLNECFEEQEQVVSIMSDTDAERILEQIKDLRAEKARFKMILDTRVQELTLNYDRKAEKIDNEEAWLTHLLQGYFEGKDITASKAGNKSYKLLSGTLKLKKQQPEFKRDEDKLTAFLMENKYTDYIQTVFKPKWAELKKSVTVQDGKAIIADTGEVVDGVEVIDRPEKFEVEI
jgi:phage host-nuclease inhibitor protein Gam